MRLFRTAVAILLAQIWLSSPLLAEGGPEIVEGNAWDVFNLGASDAPGEPVSVEYGEYRGKLPAGDYRLVARIGEARAETVVTLTDDALVEPQVIANAGVLAITAAGANSIEVLDARPDLGGNRKSHSFDYAAEKTLIAPGGDYLIVVMRGETRAEATATVRPGERAEITVP
jgi:Ca-activated chloride channel family protein